jgi:wyosine [tRNA(Phe)-imidazoG37] synthetase (radical SAM superfamily)
VVQDLGELVRGVRGRSRLPLAVIANGSPLGDPGVCEALRPREGVMPSLNAGNDALFGRINRPPRGAGLDAHVAGLRSFHDEFPARLWIEVMLLNGPNTSEQALEEIAARVARVEPDVLHLVRPTRPPAEPWVTAASEEQFEAARRVLGEHAPVLAEKENGRFECFGSGDPVAAAVDLVGRHPVEAAEMRAALARWAGGAAPGPLRRLEDDPCVPSVESGGRQFFVVGARA